MTVSKVRGKLRLPLNIVGISGPEAFNKDLEGKLGHQSLRSVQEVLT